ncbi:MAG: DUF2905 domain-containing protein [Gemmatimonadota bacterium]
MLKMENGNTGLVLVGIGIVVAIAGLLIWAGALGWFGRLPGDIRIESDNAHLHVPIVSMLLISLVVSLVLYAVRRFF